MEDIEKERVWLRFDVKRDWRKFLADCSEFMADIGEVEARSFSRLYAELENPQVRKLVEACATEEDGICFIMRMAVKFVEEEKAASERAPVANLGYAATGTACETSSVTTHAS